MTSNKFNTVRKFCESHSDPAIIQKYQKYFKEGYDGYGIDDKLFKQQIALWQEEWQDEMNLASYLELGDELMQNGRAPCCASSGKNIPLK